MGSEGGAAASPSSSTSPATTAASPSVKRGRDPEDEVYVDNLHSHKRYLSEIMASSLNGLTVGDPLSENLMDSPVRSESMMPYLRDEISVQYSPMSEDSDDSRYYESSTNTCSSQPESAPTSPVSPYRCQKPLTGFISGPPATSYPPHVSSSASPQPRQRGSDTEGRFPSSPSDICHSADLRRAALLRSVQMRAQPLGSSQFESGNNMEAEERSCSYMKLDVDERAYQISECSMLDRDKKEKSCRTLTMNLKGDESSEGNNIEAEERSCSYMKLDVDERAYQIGECSMLDCDKKEKSCRTLTMNLKGDESSDGNNIEGEDRSCSYMKLDVDERAYQIGECSMSDRDKKEKSCGTLTMNLKGDESSGE